MDIKLDMECIQLMNYFESFTGVKAKDCLVKNGCVYFVTDANNAQIAIGRNGRVVKNLEMKIGKKVKVFEYSPDVSTFVKNLIPQANEITINGTVVDVKVNKTDRYFIIGRDSRNINIIKEILQRNSNVSDLNLR